MARSRPALVFDARRELVRDRAKKIKSGKYEVAEIWIGGWNGLDLSTCRCALDGGRFPEVGRALMFRDKDGTLLYIHFGDYYGRPDYCEVDAWAADPEESDAA